MCLFKNSFMLSEYIKETSCRHTEVPQTNRVLAVVRFAFISPVNLVSALRIRCTSTMYRNQEFGLLLEALALQLEIRGMAWLRELCSRKVEFLFFISKNSVFICWNELHSCQFADGFSLTIAALGGLEHICIHHLASENWQGDVRLWV